MPESGDYIPDPPRDWAQFGCPVCGLLETLPASPGEQPPYCVSDHRNGAPIQIGNNYAWRDATKGERWTQMVPVRARVR